MPLFNAKILIKELRKARGLTQQQLAEGICSRQTVYMIERGERRPDWPVFQEIMARLGVNPEEYYSDFASDDDIRIANLLVECNGYLRAFDFAAIKKILGECEKDPLFSEGNGKLFLLNLKAHHFSQGDYKNTELSIKNALEYMQIIRPGFEIEKITDYFLSGREMKMINTIATAYKHSGEGARAIEIRQMLKANLEKKHMKESYENERYLDLTSNIAHSLMTENRLDECIKTCDEGIAAALSHHDTRVYMRLIGYKARSLMLLGKTAEGEPLYKKYLHYAYAMDGYARIDFAFEKEEFEEIFGRTLNLDLPW